MVFPISIQKNTLQISLLVCFFVISFLLPQSAHAEHIEAFVADIEIRKDTVVTVSEKITYVFTEDRHGIERCIPTIHYEKASSFLKERYIDIALQSVRMDTLQVPYTVHEGNEWCVKIGNPDETITGNHEYEIVYVVSGAVSYQQSGGAELYWNVTGNEWTVPMRHVEVHITSPDQIMLQERACYRGFANEAGSCEKRIAADGDPTFSSNNLSVGEGLTIAQALNRSIISNDVRERYKIEWMLIFVVLFGIPLIGIAIYRYKTKFKTGHTIIPQYEPYADVKPMYAGFLFDRRLDPRDITAGIVYLAREKFLSIRKTESKVLFVFEVDDYEMTLLRPFADTTDLFEMQLLSLIFGENAEPGKKVTLNDLKNDYSVAQKNIKIILALTRGLRMDMKEQGFYAGFSFNSSADKTRTGFLLLLVVIISFVSQIAMILLIALGIVVVLALFDGRRTGKGYEALDHLKGFKDFLSVTESQRYIFHNAPALNAEQFMEYLPYAIAFGVEKQWAKTFEKITIPNPDWYDGGTGAHTFNAVALSQSLGGFSTAFAASSGVSASSGGGSAGGGAGGGGGSSW